MMYVDAKLFYRGACPTKEYISSLQEKLKMRFVNVELKEIQEESFHYASLYTVSHIICPGNPELTLNDTLYSTYVDYKMPVTFEWEYAVYPGSNHVYCKKGDYQVLTYDRSFAILWFFKKFFGRKNVE